jgi:formylglycine-generating enzyme required for sulfatase activity
MRLANAWGFVDMSGNAQEWVFDNYDDDYYEDGQVDPTGPVTSSYRGVRSGAYFGFPDFCRVANRSFDSPTATREARGLRIVRTLH